MSALLSLARRIPFEPRLRRRALLFVLVLALSFVPMAGTLGYFSSLLLAPLLSLLAAAAGVDNVRAIRVTPMSDGPSSLERVATLGMRELAWLLGIPLALLLIGQLWNVNCDPIGGLAYYLLGPVASALLGWLAGVTGAIVVGDRRRSVQLLAGWAPFGFCVLVGLRRLYVDPVVFAYDPFFGWYSGPIYDELIAIGSRYLLFRAYNLAIAAAVALLLRVLVDQRLRFQWRNLAAPGADRMRTIVALALTLASGVVGLAAAERGWTATRESLAKVLSATRETEHFEIHYVPNSITAREIEFVVAEHEFAWHALEQRLGSAPRRKVQSFVFLTGEQRQALLGADKVEVSPPWRQEMYLSHRPWPHDVMPHELGHAFMGDFGDPLLGLPLKLGKFNGALIEGVPTALAPRPLDNLDLHEQAAVLDRLEKRPPMATIMGAGFYAAAAARAYTAAGSFVLWLAETRGWPTITALYDNAGDFEAVYGESLEQLEQEWLEFLRSLPLREQDIEAQAQRFERAGVFRRPCAHRAADLTREAAIARTRGQQDEAIEAARTLCKIEPERPEHALLLADMLAGFGRLDEAKATLDEAAARDDLTATLAAVVEEQRGDTALVAGDLELATTHYRAALGFGLRESQRRQLEIKLMGTRDPALAPLIVEYFAPFMVDDKGPGSAMLRLWAATKIAQLPGHWALGHYLLGRQFMSIAAPEQALEVLERAMNPSPGEPALESVELRRALRWAYVGALVQNHRWDRAREILDALERDAEGNGHRAEVAQWRERVDFYEGWFGR